MHTNFFLQVLTITLILFLQSLLSSPPFTFAQSCRTSDECIGVTLSTGLTCPGGGALSNVASTYNRCDCIGGICVKQPDGLRGDLIRPGSLGTIASRLYLILIIPIGTVGFLFFLVSGYQFLMSKGDPKALEAAKARLTYAVLGLIIIFMAGAITNLIFNRFELFRPIE
jgi:hypothetical protein